MAREEGDGSRECSMGLLRLSHPGIQRAKAVMAVRLEWAHAEFLGQSQGLVVRSLGGRDLWGSAVHGDLAEEPQIRLAHPQKRDGRLVALPQGRGRHR